MFVSPFSVEFKDYYDRYFEKNTVIEHIMHTNEQIPFDLVTLTYWLLCSTKVSGVKSNNFFLYIEGNIINIQKDNQLLTGKIDVNNNQTVEEQLNSLRQTILKNGKVYEYTLNTRSFSTQFKSDYYMRFMLNTHIVGRVDNDLVKRITVNDIFINDHLFYRSSGCLIQRFNKSCIRLGSYNLKPKKYVTADEIDECIEPYLKKPKYLHYQEFTICFKNWRKIDFRCDGYNTISRTLIIYSKCDVSICPTYIFKTYFDILNGFRGSFKDDIKFRKWALDKYNLCHPDYDELANMVEDYILNNVI